MKIRPASGKDKHKIAGLMLEEFSKPPFNEKAGRYQAVKSLEHYLRTGKAFVAEEKGQLAGVIVLKKERWWEGQVILIEDLAVSQAHKGKGTETKLLNKAEAHAKKAKASMIGFTTHRRSPSLKHYTRQGYRKEKDTIFMRKELR